MKTKKTWCATVFAVLSLFLTTFAAKAEDVVTNIYVTTEWQPIYEGCEGLDRVTLTSASAYGGWVSGTFFPKYPVMADGVLSVQFQLWNANNVKGVLTEFKVEDQVLYVRASEKDPARYKGGVTNPPGECDLTIPGYNKVNLMTDPKGSDGYGIKQLAFSVKLPADIVVLGSPIEPGTPDHDGWGENGGLTPGETYSFHPPADGMSPEGDVRWTCRGWSFTGADGTTDSGTGREFTFTYTQKGTLTWLFDAEYKVDFTCDGGMVDTNKDWYAHGENLSVTCTPGEDLVFVRWACDDPDLESRLTSNPISFGVYRPESIAAVLGEPIVVPLGGDVVSAVADAQSGAVILLEDGVYDIESEIVLDKPLTLKSRNGAERTVIRRVNIDTAGAVQRCVRMTHPQATVRGVALTGGASYAQHASAQQEEINTGAGVYMTAGTLADCIVTNNVHCQTVNGDSYVYGGGVAMLGDGLVTGCTIAENGARSTILGGKLMLYGGGVYMTGGLLSDCTVSDNVQNCLLGGNSGGGASGNGTGVRANGGEIVRCRILRNVIVNPGATIKTGYGAGLYANGVAEVSDTLIADNETTMTSGAGGGVYAAKALTLRNCTITGNRALVGGGLAADEVKVILCNCIVQGNDSLGAGEAPDIRLQGGMEFRSCLLTDSPRAVFADAANGDYSLASVASPGVDAGADGEVAGTTDLAGRARKVGPVDIGCFELQRAADAVGFTQSSDDTVVGGEVAFVASAVPGTTGAEWAWRVDGGAWSAWSEANERTVAFAAEGVHTVELKGLVGGAETSGTFAGAVRVYPAEITAAATAEGVLAAIAQAGGGTVVHVPAGDYTFDRTIVIDREMTLVGDAGADVTRFFRQTQADVQTSQRCLTLNHPKAVAKGITFSGGRNNSPNFTDFTEDNVGAGVWIARAGGTLDSCVVSNSVMSQCRGAGLGMEGPGVVTNCLITDSSCTPSSITGKTQRFYGAGVYLSDGLIVDSTVCRSTGLSTYMCYGGGVYMDGGALSRCMIAENAISMGLSGQLGGGVYLAKAAAKMDNCLVFLNTNNATAGKGGGIAAVAGAQVVNCTIVRNESRNDGGGAYAEGATALFANCIMADNVSGTSGDNYVGGAASAVYCCIPGLDPSLLGTGSIAADPLFADAEAANYELTRNSPCVNAGSNDFVSEGALDFAGNPRIRVFGGKPKHDVVDMGCYESPYNHMKGMTLLFW